MSLKENINYIKEEVSNEDKIFESFFKLEKFYKKYKFIIIASIISILSYVITVNVLSYLKEQSDIKANIAYNKVLLNNKDDKSLQILKEENKVLFDIATYKNSNDNTLQNDVLYLKQIALFNKAIKEKDIKTIDSLIIDSNFLLRDYAIFNKALLLIDDKNYIKAKKTLEQIANTSEIKQASDLLKHFLLTKVK